MDSDGPVDCDILSDNVSSWLSEVCELLLCDSVMKTNFNKIQSTMKKDELATKFLDALVYLKKQNDALNQVKSLKNENDTLKTKLIDCQQNVIGLQGELLASRTDLLETLQATVKTSVGDTVKAEFVSYSAVVQKNQTCSLEPERLNSVVRQVVEDTDRSRSLMVFGLPEEADEKLCDKVSSVFGAIDEKPRFEACRLGKQKSSVQGVARPVKVTLSSTSTAHHILTKAKNLRHIDSYKTVFINPDRSPEQRVKHRELVQQLKTMATNEPNKKHFIKDGMICSTEK